MDEKPLRASIRHFEYLRLSASLKWSANSISNLANMAAGSSTPPLIWMGPGLKLDRPTPEEWIASARQALRKELARHRELLRQLDAILDEQQPEEDGRDAAPQEVRHG